MPFRDERSERTIYSSQSLLGPFATNYYNKSNAVQPTPGHIPARPHKDLPTRRPKDQDARLTLHLDRLPVHHPDCPTDWQHEASQMATIYPMDQPVWCAELQSRDKHDSKDMSRQNLHTRHFDVLVLQPIDLDLGQFVRVRLGKFEQILTKPHYMSLDEEDQFEGVEPMVFYLEWLVLLP